MYLCKPTPSIRRVGGIGIIIVVVVAVVVAVSTVVHSI